MIGRREATGELAEVYAKLSGRPMPSVYATPHGDAAGIIRIHSLDPQLMLRVFRFSGTLAEGETLPWARRELINAVTSRLNQCFY
jgi:alkylhydroperoxidase family enzyme